MIKIFKKDLQINFVNHRRAAYLISLVFIAIGLFTFFMRGEKNFGIDFNGGLIMERHFTEPINIGAVRHALSEVNLGESIIQESDKGTTFLIRTEKEKSVTAVIDDKLKERFKDRIDPASYVIRTDMVGPTIGSELRQKAIIAVIISWAAIIVYVTIRYKFKFAVAAVIALIHDVLVTVGALALTGREINFLEIVALLVIVGYSVNDTIVIYDRIRENLKLRKGEALIKICNTSINQTLGRTIITTFSTALCVLVLFTVVGEAISGFAFALLIGMFSGVYSTIFIACSLVVSWQRK